MAVVVAASLAYEAIQNRGPKVVIVFESGEGLTAGKSKVKYRQVEIGTVDLIRVRDLEHVEVHRHFMGLEQQREIPYQEAVAHWYDEVYLPVVEIIRQRGMLRDFPGRTETDLYIWLAEHRAALQDSLGWEIGPDAAAADLATRLSPRPGRVIARVG